MNKDVIKKLFIENNIDINLHYLNRYIKLIYSNYEKYNGVKEKHHILPKSLFPSFIKNRDNIIALPLRVHFIVHYILTKMLPTNKEMCFSFFNMSRCRKYKENPSSRRYLVSRSKFIHYIRNLALERIKNGTHNFIGDNQVKPKKQKCKVHPFIGGELQRKTSLRLVKEGTHSFLNVKPWNSNTSNNRSKTVWYYAIEIEKWSKENPNLSYLKLYNYLVQTYKINVNFKTVRNVLYKIRKDNWSPINDLSWIEFKKTFSNLETLEIIEDSYCIKLPWTHYRNTSSSLLSWSLANEIKYFVDNNPTNKYECIANKFIKNAAIETRFGYKLKPSNLASTIIKLQKGWIPEKDKDWVKFKKSYLAG